MPNKDGQLILRMVIVLMLVTLLFKAVIGSGAPINRRWCKGCYEPRVQNLTRFDITQPWHDPAHCTALCANSRWRYAAVRGESICHCLQTLRLYLKVDSVNCTFKCANATSLRCGGRNMFNIFDASVSVIYNQSVSSPSYVDIANISRFTCHASLTSSKRTGERYVKNHTAADMALRQSVLITWKIDGSIVKLSNRTVRSRHVDDVMYRKFNVPSTRSVCCNVSNKHSWQSSCSSVLGLESIRGFKLVNVQGGYHMPDGRYSIPTRGMFHLDVVVMAGSYATFIFDFGDGTPLAHVKPDYSRVKRNCSCLALTRKHYFYRKGGLFSLNITAVNHLGSHSLFFPKKFVVEEAITMAKIQTGFAAAGKMSVVKVETRGSSPHAVYEWTLDNRERRVTSQPYIELLFPDSQSQYHIKIFVFNNVSRVESSKIIYIEPEIKDVILKVNNNISIVNEKVIFTAVPMLAHASFASAVWYKWDLGDGEYLPGSLPKLIYKYKTFGRLQARVQAENYVSRVYSKNVSVHIFAAITKVDISYKPFLFGEATWLHATVKDGSEVTYIWDFGDGEFLITENDTIFHNFTKPGKYNVMVVAKNLVSFKEGAVELFVTKYFCKKPVLSVTKKSYVKTVEVSSTLRMDINIGINCSVSGKAIYKWTIFDNSNGSKIEKTPQDIGVSPLVLSERSLILPPYTLSPGEYLVKLMVQMAGTIVYSNMEKIVNIKPSKMKAVIKGGTAILVSRKSHKNVTLDASHSYDPDDRSFRGLSFNWVCKSVLHDSLGDCFQPSTVTGINWNLPTLQVRPQLLKYAPLFAFIVTVSRGALQRSSSAIQFMQVEDNALRRLKIDFIDCKGDDINSHKDVKFKGTCGDCNDVPIVYQWKVDFKLKSHNHLSHFDLCVPADGSAWRKSASLNSTNTTTATTVTSTTAASPTTATTSTVVASTPLPAIDQIDFQKFICKSELENLRENWTDFNPKTRKRRSSMDGSAVLKGLDSQMKGGGVASDARSETVDRVSEIMERRGRRSADSGTGDTSGNTNSGSSGASSGANDRSLDRSQGLIRSASSNGEGSTSKAMTAGPISGNLDSSSRSGSGRDPSSSHPESDGQSLSSSGVDRGCEGAASGVGRGCTVDNAGFGEGSRNHIFSNTTTWAFSPPRKSDKANGNLVSADSYWLESKLKMIREIVDLRVITTGLRWGLNSDEFLIKKNTLIPGQLYKVEFTAFWQNNSNERVAGKASQYFLTNTGPFQGSCAISPLIGTEVNSVFQLYCKHWRDKHNPLTFSVKYLSPVTNRPVIIYSGLENKLDFTLPAGMSKDNYTIGVEVTVKDAKGVIAELCGIPVHVLPLENSTLMVEKNIYRRTVGNESSLAKYEDLYDKVSSMIFIANVAVTVNRLQSADVTSEVHKIREEIRTRLLQSVNSFHVLSEAFALQVAGITREITTKAAEVSLKSAEVSNDICEKIVGFHHSNRVAYSKNFISEMVKDVFAIISSALSSTSRKKIHNSSRRNIGNLVNRSIKMYESIVKILRNSTTHEVLLRSDFLTTSFKPFEKMTSRTISQNGCSFILPDNSELFERNSSNNSSSISSTLSVFEGNPFHWLNKSIEIKTKVASLDILMRSGSITEVANLTKPISVKLPVQNAFISATRVFTVQESHMNVHQFNISGKGQTFFIRTEEEDDDKLSEHFALQAVLRYNEEPTQKLFNESLEFIERSAVFRISPTTDNAKVYVGIYLKGLGKFAGKKKNRIGRKYKLSAFRADCKFWDELGEQWRSTGCEATSDSTTREIVCSCYHLAAFGGDLDVIFGTVHVNLLFNFKSNDEHLHILAILASIICTYLLLAVKYGRKGNSVDAYFDIAKLPDNHPADQFKYLVIVETGSAANAGTTGRVSIVVYGEEGHSQIRELTCYNAKQFKRGSTNCVVMSFPDSLGDIKKICLWHDNGGSAPDWFLKQVTIIDCQSEKKWYFHWNDWLAVSEEDTANCEIPAKAEPLINNMQTIFEGFLDYHAWFSICARPARSSFTSFQRVITSCLMLAGYMVAATLFLCQHQKEVDEVLGIWDVKWLTFMTSVVAVFSAIPLQIAVETLFRNNMERNSKVDESEERRKSEPKKLPDEDVRRPSGAIFFMEFSSSVHSSQKVVCKGDSQYLQNDESKQGRSDVTYFLFPNWLNKFLVVSCLLLSASGFSATFLFCMSLRHEIIVLFTQAILGSLILSMFVTEVIKALVLSVRRLYKLSQDAQIKEYMSWFDFHEKSNRFRKQDDLTEKQIMAARARARFVRFSKPILGNDLTQVRRKAVPLQILSFYFWHAVTCLVLLLTLLLLLLCSDPRQKYYTNKTVKELVARPSGSISFDNISTVSQFWDWSKVNLAVLLTWESWHHLGNISTRSRKFEDEIFTFGPACMERKNLRPTVKESAFNRSLINSTAAGDRLLLFGPRASIMNTLNLLQSSQWISNATSSVKISFVYFHPESSLLSNVVFLAKVSPIFGLSMVSKVDAVSIVSKSAVWEDFLTSVKVLCFLLMVVFLRNEFCKIMDKGMGHLKSFWNIIEGSLVLFTLFATIGHVCLFVSTKKAAYSLSSMHLGDQERFLDLENVVYFEKLMLVVYATLLFLVILRSLKLLRIWRRFSILFLTLNDASTVIFSLMMMTSLIVFALTHMGVLLLMANSLDFSTVDLAWRTLWSNVNKAELKSRKGLFIESRISPLYELLAGLTLFALWRMSVVFYIGRFKAVKSIQGRQVNLLRTLKRRLRKFQSRKAWMKIFSNFWSKWFRRQEDRYKVCSLPLEDVYEEIEYQVEEVMFRLNNLFEMDEREEKLSEDEDDFTLDSSEEAAYPSSYSTKDRISVMSDSLYSENSGLYCYGEHTKRPPSALKFGKDYDGPIIHYLEPTKPFFCDLGQKLTPIFGGRYFVKTSWSTFRAPKIQPGSIKLEPPPKILPPIRKSKSTFEKVSNWSTKLPESQRIGADCCETEESTTSNLFKAKSSKKDTIPSEKIPSRKCQTNVGSTSFTNQPHKLPKALQSMADKIKFVPTFDEHNNPFQLPPKPPSLSEISARGKKRLNFTRCQISPLAIDSPSSLSIASEGSSAQERIASAYRKFKESGTARSTSLDSGIVQTSGDTETDDNSMSC